MTKVSKEQLRQSIKEDNLKSTEDVQTALRDLFAGTMQQMLEAELETHYAKHDTKNEQSPGYSRNGHSRKTLTSEYDNVEITVARDRKGEFEPKL